MRSTVMWCSSICVVAALGTGGFLFRALIIGGYVLSEDCENLLGFVNAITGFIFTILLMGFLMKYSKVSIHPPKVLKGEYQRV